MPVLGDSVHEALLELGSGTGVHFIFSPRRTLHERGGPERRHDFRANAPGAAASRHPAARSSTKATCGPSNWVKVDAVVSLFHVVSYQTTNGRVLDMFRNARDHLEPGGLFLFDVWYGPQSRRPSNC